MKIGLRVVFSMAVLGCLLTVGSVLATAQEGGAPAPDNTKDNQRDQNQAAPTADQQKANKADQETTRQIRRAVVQDKSLSTNAHNVKIISQDGVRHCPESKGIEIRGRIMAFQEWRGVAWLSIDPLTDAA